MLRIYLIGLVLLLFLSSCDDNLDVTSTDFVGTWKVYKETERYVDGEYDENYSYTSDDMILTFNQDGSGLVSDVFFTDKELVWAYVPTTQRIYFHAEIDSIFNLNGVMNVIEVKGSSQQWKSELSYQNFRYEYTWDLELQ